MVHLLEGGLDVADADLLRDEGVEIELSAEQMDAMLSGHIR